MSSNNSSSNRINVPEAKQAMAKKMRPIRTANYERQSRTAVGHVHRVAYIAALTV